MRKLILISLVALFALPSVEAQTPTLSKREIRRIQKEERKNAAAEQAKMEMQKTLQLFKDTLFVLEADMIYDRYGQNKQVDQLINFVSVVRNEGVIQLGDNFQIGSNFLGGVTLEGPMDDYEMRYDEKRGIASVSFMVRSPRGTYDVTMTSLGGTRADATIRGSFSGSIRFIGDLKHPAESQVFKGVSL